MKNKKGVTMMILVVYIVLALLIMGIVTSRFLSNRGIQETQESTFKARINEYIDEFESMKGYYTLDGTFSNSISISGYEQDSNGRTLSDYIPSITVDDRAFICIDDGELAFYGINSSDVRYNYLIELGLELAD